jgi:hypothetical protein
VSGTDDRERSSHLDRPVDDPDDLLDIEDLRYRLIGKNLKWLDGPMDRIDFMLPGCAPGVHQRLLEIAGEAAVDIVWEFLRYSSAKVVEEHNVDTQRKIARAVAAIRELQSLSLSSVDLELAQIDREQFEKLPHVGMFKGINRLADLLESSPLMNRPRGHPEKHIERSFAVAVAQRLHDVGIRVTSTPGGALDEILCLLLEVDSVSGRLLRHAARAVKSTASD